MGQFDFKYVSTPAEARAQVVAYMNQVGEQIQEINDDENRVME